ncbi:B3 domain-containing transcription factor VRN1 [Linum perenne]
MAASLHFFKNISPEDIRDNKLMLPKKFIGRFKNHLSDSVTLEVPDGRTWTVELDREQERDNKVWLASGLNHFFRFYSISERQILLFKYLVPDHLKVFICKSSSMEITYPAHPNPEPEIESPDIEIWKKMKNNRKIIVSNRFDPTFWKASEGTKMAIGRAVDTNPTNLSAMVVIVEFHATCGMYLPIRFTKQWGAKNQKKMTKLRLYDEGSSDGRAHSWLVRMVESTIPNRLFLKGWHRFRDDVKLVVGDVCLFELIQPDEGEKFLGIRVFKGADQ